MLPGREGPDQRDRLARLRKRQQVAVVLQQDDRLAAGLARKRPVLRKQRARLFALLVDPPERILEQAEHVLRREHPADRGVQHGFRNFAGSDEVGHMLAVEAALHAHVDAGEEREPCRVAPVLGIAVRDHFLVAGVVGDDEALETPLAAQQVGHQPVVSGRRNPRDFVERGHRREGARVEARLVRRQIDFAQRALRHVDGIVVEPRLGGAVGREMLDAGEHVLVRLEVGALEAAHARRGEDLAEHRVLAAAFDAASPALVASDVDHRREGPVDARAGRFECGGLRRAAGELGLEARDFGQRHGEDGAVAVNDVGGEDERDLEPRFLDRRRLKNPRHARAIAVEDAGELARAGFLHLLREIAVRGGIERGGGRAAPGRGHQAQLPGLFLESHPRKQIVDERRHSHPACRLQKRARGACQPGCYGARAHERGPARNARVEHSLSPSSCALSGAPSNRRIRVLDELCNRLHDLAER